MSFDEIMKTIRYTDWPQQEYLDRFHDMCQLQDKWNTHMKTDYFTGWWNYLGKSMQIHLNPYVPGWMCIPRKPHPFGN